jgi:hypothetical protein
MRKTLSIIILSAILIITGCAYSIYKYSLNTGTGTKIALNKDEVTFIQTLKDSNGTPLGDLNVLDLNPKSKTFSALFISKLVDGKNVIIYQVDANGSSNTLGQDSAGAGKEPFFGLQFASVGTDNFTFYILTDKGKGISDAQVVHWNETKDEFELIKPDFEDPIYTQNTPVGVLKDSAGEVLGELSVAYNGADKSTLKALFVRKTTPNKVSGLYRITEDGFFNTSGQEQEILGPNFYGFELVSIQGDHFTVRILYQNGKIKSDAITIGWNADKRIFEVSSQS